MLTSNKYIQQPSVLDLTEDTDVFNTVGDYSDLYPDLATTPNKSYLDVSRPPSTFTPDFDYTSVARPKLVNTALPDFVLDIANPFVTQSDISNMLSQTGGGGGGGFFSSLLSPSSIANALLSGNFSNLNLNTTTQVDTTDTTNTTADSRRCRRSGCC